MATSTFELIPNEILLEIFEYLSPYHIFQSFYFLNKHYENFLLTLQLKLDLFNIRKTDFDYCNYSLFLLVPHRIVAFRCEDQFDRLIYQIRLCEFISLKYLTIVDLNVNNLLLIIPQLNALKNLIDLNLQTHTTTFEESRIIFQGQLPAMEKCILNINKQIIFHGDHSYPSLRDLMINHCTIDDLLLFLQTYTPALRYLTVTLIDRDIRNEIDALDQHLESLVIKTSTISFQRLSNTIFRLFPYLQRLSITATGIDYTNGKQWTILLSTNFSHLINFQLHITFLLDDAPTPNDRLQLLGTFQTSYFRAHQWYFGIIHRPSTTEIALYSIPVPETKISHNLYQSDIHTTLIDRTIFRNINELSLFLRNTNENPSEILFPNVRNLKLISEFREYESFPKHLFVDISHRVPFSKLQSLQFTGRYFPSSSLVLLDYTPRLHSLTIPLNSLIKMTKVLTDAPICYRLSSLITHLTITCIDQMKDLAIFERLPIVFPHLDSLSLSLENPRELYILIIVIIPKMSPLLKSLTISIAAFDDDDLLDKFMLWLMDYMHTRDLDLVDVKLTNYQLCFAF